MSNPARPRGAPPTGHRQAPTCQLQAAVDARYLVLHLTVWRVDEASASHFALEQPRVPSVQPVVSKRCLPPFHSAKGVDLGLALTQELPHRHCNRVSTCGAASAKHAVYAAKAAPVGSHAHLAAALPRRVEAACAAALMLRIAPALLSGEGFLIAPDLPSGDGFLSPPPPPPPPWGHMPATGLSHCPPPIAPCPPAPPCLLGVAPAPMSREGSMTR
eukprot:CAMPEP_0172067948 /NCGR_PEP_ID=MMETSP1043-20130122/11957_1 /TAXON_ID=464988 /ORGANISM="Hemiselmis andersenii, Strain CCMP441" /LENGTH=215 /DNA_ID=CAMNT_0012728189 /DNA_START=278 /DNA_END=927 /DNA_ORIENTATION=-